MDHERKLVQWDLYKSYGEFNFLFEDTIQEYRMLIIAIIRISYEYFEEEDENEDELPYQEQDRLLKIMMNNMGAFEIVQNSKACFIDYFNKQKQKHGNYSFPWFDERLVLPESAYQFALKTFKKTLDLIELRNVLIHSHYFESFSISKINGKLKGFKDVRTSKGFERRNYSFDINLIEKINDHISDLLQHVMLIRYNLSLDDKYGKDYKEELLNLEKMNFSSDDILKK